MAITQLVRRVGKEIAKGGKFFGKNKKKIGLIGASAVGVGAGITAQGVAGKGAYDVYKQRRKEGENKTGAGLRTFSPVHVYGSGRRLARTNKKARGFKAGLGYGPIGLAGYLKEKKRLKGNKSK